ncbi:MAG TPA: hypothetical protein V6C82_03400 [Chroococcales cyanobacterium]|jgi:hypothetical protein
MGKHPPGATRTQDIKNRIEERFQIADEGLVFAKANRSYGIEQLPLFDHYKFQFELLPDLFLAHD